MPFPEINEALRRPAHRPHWTQRWLREIFVEDLGLKLLALIISLALWYGVTGQRAPTTIRVPRVPLNFRLPGDTEISNEARTEVEVTLTGSKHALDTINVRDLSVNVDVSDLKPGEYPLQLTPERVTMGLPDGVRYGDIQPNNVMLRLEPRVERELEVEVRHAGNVPEGYELSSVAAVPEKVKVRGPASHVNVLQKAPTEIISLEGRKESFTLPQAAIQIDDKKVDLIDAVVSVRVEIEERPTTKTFTNVSVQALPGLPMSPAIASVTLFGPPSLLNKLSAADFQIALESGTDGSIKPRLILPTDMEGRVELRSYKLQ
jgi:YbbR domain-containing protein